jgi:hypothetical protein
MIEYIVILAVLLFIAVLFYKQANEQFEILQITAERIQELPTLYQDRSPIVVSDFPTPNLGTYAEISKRPHIMQMYLPSPSPHMHAPTIGQAIHSRMLFPLKGAEVLAKESGLNVWFEHHLYKALLPSPYTSWVYSFKTSLWPNKRGMFKTKAFQTLLMPTQGTAILTLMLPKMIPYLPTKWSGRAFSSLSSQDTPLLSEIKFLEIRLRRGTLVLLPAHLIADIRSEEDSWTFMAEIHHPVSYMVPD